MSPVLIATGVLIALVMYVCLLQIESTPCVIRITGESITISSCKITPELIQAVQSLQPLHIEGLSFISN
uniref:Movement protein TGBp3 n=1 Tax=Yam virus X TaxID=1503864 RepID=A0A0B4VLL6_9VIRU|nr:triple gene block protein 3 [Yam virus X]AJD23379.1 triple gene block protein 3 [Yam virus X]AJD23384.1 triple gene block protein 3 [Yam virus X]AJD23389.1 triple gene block protein 3 [Yam virus X]